MSKVTLVVMAAGIGSRFGGGIKQLEAVGPNGEIIMDYSIYDALETGFNKVVFVIRKDLEKDFKEIIGRRMEKLVEVEYAYQELDDIPERLRLLLRLGVLPLLRLVFRFLWVWLLLLAGQLAIGAAAGTGCAGAFGFAVSSVAGRFVLCFPHHTISCARWRASAAPDFPRVSTGYTTFSRQAA